MEKGYTAMLVRIGGILVLAIFLSFGFLLLLWPNKVREYYLKNYIRGLSSVEPLDLSSWVRYYPSVFVFRIAGVLCIGAVIFILYVILTR